MKLRLSPRALKIIRTPTPFALWVFALTLAVAAGGIWYLKKGPTPPELVVASADTETELPVEEDPVPYVAIVIDGSPDARPTNGLQAAELIMEFPVEPPITRYLAVFRSDAKADEIGPVRSARPYFLDTVREFDALYAHVGGSPGALEALRRLPVRDLNEYSNGRFFWRSSKRPQPHHIFTSIALMRDALQAKEVVASSTLPSWTYKKDAPAGWDAPDGWTYEGGANNYIEKWTGTLAKNVAIMKTDIATIDAVGRQRVRTLGEGKATVHRDGVAIEAIWKKKTPTHKLRFFRTDDQSEIVWNKGLTWIVVTQ